MEKFIIIITYVLLYCVGFFRKKTCSLGFPLPLWDLALLPEMSCLFPFPTHCFHLFHLQICSRLTHSESLSSSNSYLPLKPWSFLSSPMAAKECFSWLPAGSHRPLLSYPAQSGSHSQCLTVIIPSEGACDLLLWNPVGCSFDLIPLDLCSIWPCWSPLELENSSSLSLCCTFPFFPFLSPTVPCSLPITIGIPLCPGASCLLSSLLGDLSHPLPQTPSSLYFYFN